MAIGNGSYFGTAGLLIKKEPGQPPTSNGSYFGTAGLPAKPRVIVDDRKFNKGIKRGENRGVV